MKITKASQPDTPADLEVRKQIDAMVPFSVVAGAGSGKTTTLVKGLAHTLSRYRQSLSQRGQKAACITYTEVAAAEIKAEVAGDPLCHVSTIHSFLWEAIRPFQGDIRNHLTVAIENELQRLSDKAAQSPKNPSKSLVEKIESAKRAIQGVRQAPSFRYGKGSNYQKGELGHEDVISIACGLVDSHPLLRKVLAGRFPFIFVDESQDTFPEVVKALLAVAAEVQQRLCLGFFGDPMQKIYLRGVGHVVLENGAADIAKPENFRSSKTVRELLNRIRIPVDKLSQIPGRPDESDGTVRFFICDQKKPRSESLFNACQQMAQDTSDPRWLMPDTSEANDDDNPDARPKRLVIVHRMAATRMGFGDVYNAIQDHGPDSMKTAMAEGTLWAFRPFTDYLLPLTEAFATKHHRRVLELLRANCPLFDERELAKVADHVAFLRDTEAAVAKLTALAVDPQTTIGALLELATKSQLLVLDIRFSSQSSSSLPSGDGTSDEEDLTATADAIEIFKAAPVQQMRGYRRYIEQLSPFATQHGVKGAEFDNVLTILDDDEGRYNLYSYEKLFGIEELSTTDKKNASEGKETVLDRTLRLFYVSCSRAKQNLAVVLFTKDPGIAVAAVKEKQWFTDDQIQIDGIAPS